MSGGGFPLLSRVVVRHPLWVIATWVIAGIVLLLSLPSLAVVAAKNPGIPPEEAAPVYASTDVMNEAFSSEPAVANSVVIVLINEDGLAAAGRSDLPRVGAEAAPTPTT